MKKINFMNSLSLLGLKTYSNSGSETGKLFKTENFNLVTE